jgi:hypothetical protein
MCKGGLRLEGTQGDAESKSPLYARDMGNSWTLRPPASPIAYRLSARLIGDGADITPGKSAGPFCRACVAGTPSPGLFVSPKN